MTKKTNWTFGPGDGGILSAAFLWNFAVMLGSLCLLVPMAINNDDSIIHGITAGAYGEASAVTAHTNVALGWLLLLLQRILPWVNWFSVLEVLLLFLAFSLVTAILLLQNRGFPGLPLAAVFTLILAPEFYNGLHNTRLAPLAAAAGLLAVYSGVLQKRKLLSVLGGISALFSSLIRLNAFFIGAAFAAGVLLLLCKRCGGVGSWLREQRRYIAAFGAVFFAVFAFAAADILIVNADPAGREYREYNRLRGAVSDFPLPDYQEHIGDYRALGISENDYRLIEEWNFADFEKFDKETLAAISAMRDPAGFGETFQNFLRVLAEEGGRRCFWVMAALTLFGALFSEKGNRRSLLWIPAAYCACLFYLCHVSRTPHWVTDGLAGAGAAAALAFTGIDPARWKPRAVKLISAGTAALAAGLSLLFYLPEAGSYQSGFNRAAGEVFSSFAEREENLYLVDQATAPSNSVYRIVPTFSALPQGLYSNLYTLGGWDTGSAAKNGILARHQTDFPYRALLEQDHVFLADTKSYDGKLTYLRENVDETAEMSMYETVDGYYVFAFAGRLPYTETETIRITETDSVPDEWAGGFTYVGARAAGAPENVRAAYLELYDTALDTVRIYRGRILQSGGHTDVVLSVDTADMLEPRDMEIRVIFKTDGGAAASVRVPLLP